MPSPSLTKQLATIKFQSFKIQLPAQASLTPGGLKLAISSGVVRPAIMGVPSKVAPAPPAPALPGALFLAGSSTPDAVKLQKAMHDGYTQLFDKLTDAVKYAWDMFRQQAFFTGIMIHGPIATGPPGCLSGPAIDQFIRTAPSVVAWTGALATIRDEFARGLQASWLAWQKGVTVPGLPWYPTFATVPGPMAPPIPNVPTPLITCVSAGAASMAPSGLKTNLSLQLSGKMEYADQFSEAAAARIGPAFTRWLASQMVTNVMGKGPVPSFSPPYVPVGPVVMGDNIPAPGHLLT